MDLFRSIQMKLAQRELGATTDGLAVDLYARESPQAAQRHEDELRDEVQNEAPDEPQEVAIESGLPIGCVLRDRYEIVGRLSEGRSGSLYKAMDRLRSEHPAVDAHIAIKVLDPEADNQRDMLSQLRREFYSAQQLSHRSVVKVFELDRDQDLNFFTMELIDGEVLGAVLRKFHPQPLPRPYVWAMLREVGEGLAHAHERRVTHGDLGPQHIMVTDSGELRILGFGASGISATAMAPAYASCEVLEGREPDPRDDLFALACLSYEWLTGVHPFQQRVATEARKLNMTPARPDGLSSRQWNALTLGLSFEREGRLISVRDWLAELNPGTEPLGSIPLKRDAAPARAAVHKGVYTPTRLVALLATLIIAMVTWVVLHQPIDHSDINDEAASEATAVESAAQEALLNAQTADWPAAADEAPAAPPELKPSRSAAPARAVDKTPKIGIATPLYRIPAGDKFVEIQVQRSLGSKAGTSFEWWTEPASAVEGVDYVPQTQAIMSFPRGKSTMSLFVKLIPNASRKRKDAFYVVIGNPSSGSALGEVSKAKIALLPAKAG